MRKIIYLFLFLQLIHCNRAQSLQEIKQNYSEYPWQFTVPMPHGRYGHDAIYGANGKIYVMGGQVFLVSKGFGTEPGGWLKKKYNDGRYSNLAYTLQKHEWKYVTSIPGRFSDFVTFYDPDEDQWSEKRKPYQQLSTEDREKLYNQDEIGKKRGEKAVKIYETDLFRQGNGVAAVLMPNDSILWTGGNSYMRDAEEFVLPYCISSDDWPKAMEIKMNGGSWMKTIYETSMPPMQEPRCDHQAVATIDGIIYVLGGRRKEKIGVDLEKGTFLKKIDVVTKSMECYDPKTNRWEYRRPLERERMTFAAVAGKDDKIYVLGGAAGMADDPNTPILDTVEVYDPKSDSWSRRRPMPTPRYDHAAVLAADGRIYVMGGAESFGNISSGVYVYDPDSDSWEQGPDMIIPRAALAAAATPDGKIYAIGGTDVGAYKNKKNWEHLTSLISRSDLGDYEGKVQETVEVLDIYKWRHSKKAK